MAVIHYPVSNGRKKKQNPFNWGEMMMVVLVTPVALWLFCFIWAMAIRLQDPDAFVPYWILAPLHLIGLGD